METHRFRRPSILVLAAACLFTSLALAAADEAGEAAQRAARAAQYFNAGQFEQALAEWEAAGKLYVQANDASGRARTLQRRGEAYLALGHYPKAVAAFESAREAAAQTHDPELNAAATVGLGNAQLLSGDLTAAEATLKEAVGLARATGRRALKASARQSLGNVHAAKADYGAAATQYRLALEDADAAANNSLAAKILINLARAERDRDNANEAAAALDRAEERLDKLAPSHSLAYAWIGIGRLRESLPEANLRAYQAYDRAVQTAASIQDTRALTYGLGYMGGLYEEQGRVDEALTLTRRAIHYAQQSNTPEALYRWQWQTGRLLRSQGDPEGAIAAYERAVYTLREIRHALTRSPGAQHQSYRERLGPLYLQLADLLISRAETTPDPQKAQQDLLRVRATMEQLKGAELEDYFQDDCVAALKARTKGIDRLNEHTAAIYPIIFPDRLEILLSLPNGMKTYSTSVNGEQFRQEVHTLRRYLEKRTTHQYLPHAQQLYDWLIRPLEADLSRNDIQTLVIVPGGALRMIPLAALHDGDNFLIRRYVVATTPGLTLTDPEPIKRTEAKVMINGLTESVQGFPPLPNVGEELVAIKDLFGGKVLKNEEFQLPTIEEELTQQPYNIVHIASHGRFGGDVRNTFLLTYDGKLTMNALERYMARTAYRKEPVELLTLSACQTAAGDERAALGLAGIAVKAGARSALATLWYINDEASSMLVSEFYRQLRDPSLSKAHALQKAQLKLLDDPRYRHPSYWAPFLLIGNWL